MVEKRESTKAEIEADNSNDIYKVAARVKNLARVAAGTNLTPVGEGLCNQFTHVLVELYKFADGQGKNVRESLTKLLRKHEEMPANFIVGTIPEDKRPKVKK